jgi:hypothetical protein
LAEILKKNILMRLALIAIHFPPLRTSGAVQLRDLAIEFVRQGHNVTVMVPDSELDVGYQIQDWKGVNIVRLRAPRMHEIGYIRRTVHESLLSYAMLFQFKKSSLSATSYDGVIWYAPTIFLAPFVNYLKKKSKARSYLIQRDIFPDWAIDLGIMRKGPAYWYFTLVEKYHYSVADIIGVQTKGNLKYFNNWAKGKARNLQVLNNWLGKPIFEKCTINLSSSQLSNRKIFVYAGNMGIAQGIDVLLDLVKSLVNRRDLGFVFVGRGSEAPRLLNSAVSTQLDNVLFFDEIDPNEIAGLYAQCHVGLVALDQRHKSHNIPGKFLSYMQNGLPVLAFVNANNDLISLINKNQVGYACSNHEKDVVRDSALMVVDELLTDQYLTTRCKRLFVNKFSSEVAVKQVVNALME